MNAATANQRALVRILSAEHGHKKAAELSGVPYDLVRQWSSRDKRKTKALAITAGVTNVTNPIAQVAERIESELQQNEKQTRLSLSRYTARAAKDAESATLREAKTVKDLAGTAAITYQWQGKGDKEQSQVAVNIAILGV